MDTSPRVLFLSLLDDPGQERIVAEMGRRGAHCEVIGASSSFAAQSRFVRRVYRLPDRGGRTLRAFVAARRINSFVAASTPDILIPLDELAAGVLRDPRLIHRSSFEMRRLLVASLGAPEGFAAARSRQHLAKLALEFGVRAPRTCPVRDLVAARRVAAEFGYPIVLKRELTAGGGGIVLAFDDDTLMRGWRRSALKARAKACLGWIEGYRSEPMTHVVQEFIEGDLAFRNSVCRDGVELAGVNFLAEHRGAYDTRPSRYIRRIENAEMERSSRAVISALKLSGFVSFDFIVDDSARSKLIEMNSRVTGSTHLGRLFGADLIAPLLRTSPAPTPASPTTVALFPKALTTDPFDRRLSEAPGLLHDIPWEDPEIVEAHLRWLTREHPDAARRLTALQASRPVL